MLEATTSTASISKTKNKLRSIQEEIKKNYKKALNRKKRLRRDSAETDVEIMAPLEHSTPQRTSAKSLKCGNQPTKLLPTSQASENASLTRRQSIKAYVV